MQSTYAGVNLHFYHVTCNIPAFQNKCIFNKSGKKTMDEFENVMLVSCLIAICTIHYCISPVMELCILLYGKSGSLVAVV